MELGAGTVTGSIPARLANSSRITSAAKTPVGSRIEDKEPPSPASRDAGASASSAASSRKTTASVSETTCSDIGRHWRAGLGSAALVHLVAEEGVAHGVLERVEFGRAHQ